MPNQAMQVIMKVWPTVLRYTHGSILNRSNILMPIQTSIPVFPAVFMMYRMMKAHLRIIRLTTIMQAIQIFLGPVPGTNQSALMSCMHPTHFTEKKWRRHMYQMDVQLGLMITTEYSIGITNTETYAYSEADTSSNVLYKYLQDPPIMNPTTPSA
jgi:hypothetical protein